MPVDDRYLEAPGATLSTEGLLTRSNDHDPENGKVILEHVILSVKGMTCTSSEQRLPNYAKSLQLARSITKSLLVNQVVYNMNHHE